MALLTCSNLSLGYEGKEIIGNLSFEVNEGDYLCIVGENGSGKSTLMKTILGLNSPLGGSVTTGGGLKQTEIGYLRFPGFRLGNSPLRLSEQAGLQTVLRQSREGPCEKEYGKARSHSALRQMLPRALGRSAAESAARARALRDQKNASARRTRLRS